MFGLNFLIKYSYLNQILSLSQSNSLSLNQILSISIKFSLGQSNYFSLNQTLSLNQILSLIQIILPNISLSINFSLFPSSNLSSHWFSNHIFMNQYTYMYFCYFMYIVMNQYISMYFCYFMGNYQFFIDIFKLWYFKTFLCHMWYCHKEVVLDFEIYILSCYNITYPIPIVS